MREDIITYYFEEEIPVWDIMDKTQENLEGGLCYVGLTPSLRRQSLLICQPL